jgi:uncharacterized pyridoxal phosphate-containing UPF0001 family protein
MILTIKMFADFKIAIAPGSMCLRIDRAIVGEQM